MLTKAEKAKSSDESLVNNGLKANGIYQEKPAQPVISLRQFHDSEEFAELFLTPTFEISQIAYGRVNVNEEYILEKSSN